MGLQRVGHDWATELNWLNWTDWTEPHIPPLVTYRTCSAWITRLGRRCITCILRMKTLIHNVEGGQASPLCRWAQGQAGMQNRLVWPQACADWRVLKHRPEPGDFRLHQLYCQFIMMHWLCTEIHDIFQVLYLCFTGSNPCTSCWMNISVTQFQAQMGTQPHI